MASDQEKPKKLLLPAEVVTPSDIAKLIGELQFIENTLLQLRMRNPGSSVALPQIGKRMQKVIDLNGINVIQVSDRHELEALLIKTKEKAPKMHISFSSEPTARFLENLILWLRREIHPELLLTIGLQPAIGAGCMVRTTNKFFDLSLKQTFTDKRHLLLEQLIPPVKVQEAPTT